MSIPKRAADFDPADPAAGDLAEAGRKRGTQSTRTGQACDRCKVRKIRCDARPGGCTPCLHSNAECKTTDRVTGRTTARGHVESLESDNAALRLQLAELRRQLHEQRPTHRDSTSSHIATALTNGEDIASSSHSDPPTARAHDPHSLASILNPAPSPPLRATSVLPQYDPNSIGDNYLGVSSSNDWPCPTSGSFFSLFGMKLDLKDYIRTENEELATLTTYESFFEFAYDRNCPAPPLPTYQDTRVLCEYWFKLGGSWCPILHKPEFLSMVNRLYFEPGFKMSDSETVQFHCLVTLMYYQLKIRTRAPTTYDWSQHYRYAVSFWPRLMKNSDLPSLQALMAIVYVLRNFQKPGAYWIVTAQVMSKIIEAGYHRSVRAWPCDSLALTPHEIEMRKRLFWSILACHSSLAYRLGRPLIVRLDDFDVELPSPIPDNLPEEENLPAHRKCSFLVGIEFFKLLIIQLQIYGQFLSVRPPRQDYDQIQRRLRRQLDYWVSSIPTHLTGGGQLAMEEKAFTLYISFAHQGARLLLHHPAFLDRPNEALMKNNLDNCLDASSQLLSISKQLKALKILDATWHNTTYYLNAIFTTLFAHSYRRDMLTTAQLASLKSDMADWLEVMAEIGSLLGSDDGLPTTLRLIVGTTITDLTQSLQARIGTSDISHDWSASRAEYGQDTVNATPDGSSSWDSHTQASSRGPDLSFHGYSGPSTAYTPQSPYAAGPHNQSVHYDQTHDPGQYQDDMKFRISALAQSGLTTPTVDHPNSTAASYGLHQPQNDFPYSSAPAPYAQQQQQPSRSAWDAFADNVSSTIQEPGAPAEQDSTPAWAAVNRAEDKSKSASPAVAGYAAAPGAQDPSYAWEGMPQNLISWQQGTRNGA